MRQYTFSYTKTYNDHPRRAGSGQAARSFDLDLIVLHPITSAAISGLFYSIVSHADVRYLNILERNGAYALSFSWIVLWFLPPLLHSSTGSHRNSTTPHRSPSLHHHVLGDRPGRGRGRDSLKLSYRVSNRSSHSPGWGTFLDTISRSAGAWFLPLSLLIHHTYKSWVATQKQPLKLRTVVLVRTD